MLEQDDDDREGTWRSLLAPDGVALLGFERGVDAVTGVGALCAALGHGTLEVPATRAGLTALLHPDDRAAAAAWLDPQADGEGPLGRLRHHDGSYRPYHHRTRRLPGAAGALSLWRPSGPPPMQLVGLAGHELRAPLNGLLALLDLMRRLGGGELQQRYLGLAAESAGRLQQVLDDMLELARLGSPGAAMRADWIDLDRTLCAAARSITPQLGWRDFGFVYDIEGEVEEVLLDGGMLSQVVVNLLANAARHTVQGHVGLRLASRLIGAGEAALELQIEDTGSGIAPQWLPRLFDPFALAGEARRHGGAGLGLSIVQALVAAMGGRIEVDSRLGEGTRFTLHFVCPARGAPPPRPLPAAARPQVWLLYAPPFVAGARWLAPRLHRLGADSTELPGVAATIERLRTEAAPQLLLIAAHSIDHAGELHRLRAALPHSRFALATRLDWRRPDLEQAALDIGAELLAVPLARADLRRLLEPGPPRAAPPPAPPATALAGHVLLVEDDPLGSMIVVEMLRTLRLRITVALSGEEALQQCAQSAPDVMLLDLMLPGIDGTETARRLRTAQRQGAMRRFPIIAFTGAPGAMAELAPFDAVLAKPSPLQAMREALAPWLPAPRD